MTQTLEEKLKHRMWEATDNDLLPYEVVTYQDALSICQEAVKEAKIEECRHWQDAIFSPQSTIAQLSVVDFQLRIAVLNNILPESPELKEKL